MRIIWKEFAMASPLSSNSALLVQRFRWAASTAGGCLAQSLPERTLRPYCARQMGKPVLRKMPSGMRAPHKSSWTSFRAARGCWVGCACESRAWVSTWGGGRRRYWRSPAAVPLPPSDTHDRSAAEGRPPHDYVACVLCGGNCAEKDSKGLPAINSWPFSIFSLSKNFREIAFCCPFQ